MKFTENIIEPYEISINPYPAYYNNTWTITRQNARRIRVHFAWIKTEAYYDKITTNAGDTFSGDMDNVWSKWINGNEFKITFTSDGSIQKQGFLIDKIEYERNYSADNYNIDGFIVYVYRSDDGNEYTFGTNPSAELPFYLAPDARAFVMYGVPADSYYTFGVQAYRIVDPDINETGVIKSSIVKSLFTGDGNEGNENPYHPETTVEYKGNILNTVQIVDENKQIQGNLNTIITYSNEGHNAYEGTKGISSIYSKST